MKRLGDILREARERRGLTRQKLARLVGYASLNKGARRIEELERYGDSSDDLCERLIEALEIRPHEIAQGLEAERKARAAEWEAYLQEFESWVNHPTAPKLIVRAIPGVAIAQPIPEEILNSSEGARALERYACQFALKHGKKVCLKLSRRHSTWINERGEVALRTEATPEDPHNGPLTFVRKRPVEDMLRPVPINSPRAFKRPEDDEG